MSWLFSFNAAWNNFPNLFFGSILIFYKGIINSVKQDLLTRLKISLDFFKFQDAHPWI